MAQANKICGHCGELGHSKFYCKKRPNKAIPQNGKTKKAWLATRSRWLKENWPNHQGYYECYICHKWVDTKDITLDHVIPRSNRPDLIHDFNNLKPCCATCNSEKGSKHI